MVMMMMMMMMITTTVTMMMMMRTTVIVMMMMMMITITVMVVMMMMMTIESLRFRYFGKYRNLSIKCVSSTEVKIGLFLLLYAPHVSLLQSTTIIPQLCYCVTVIFILKFWYNGKYRNRKLSHDDDHTTVVSVLDSHF